MPQEGEILIPASVLSWLNHIPVNQGVLAIHGSVPNNNVVDDLSDYGMNDSVSTESEFTLLSAGVEVHLSASLVVFLQNLVYAPFRTMPAPGQALSVEFSENHPEVALVQVVNPQPIQWVPVHDNVELLQASEDILSENVIANETSAGSRKRRRQLPELEPAADSVSETSVMLPRRSSRSNKFQGFKQIFVGDNPKRKSHVKPRSVPGKKRNILAKSKGKEVSHDGDAVATDDPVLKPTPVKFLQHVGVEICGIPAEEISADQLLLPRKDGAPSSAQD
jgi:hypothetical protein